MKADSSISRQHGSTGLGLSIVKSMAKMMGDSIAVESAQGEGTVFTVTFPVDAASAQDAQAFKAQMNVAAPTATEKAAEAPLAGMVCKRLNVSARPIVLMRRQYPLSP